MAGVEARNQITSPVLREETSWLSVGGWSLRKTSTTANLWTMTRSPVLYVKSHCSASQYLNAGKQKNIWKMDER